MARRASPLPGAPSSFVRTVVYPLRDRGAAVMADASMTTALRAFLAEVHAPMIIADYQNDLLRGPACANETT